MVKILKEKSSSREGNDCLISSTVLLLQFSSWHYVVISTEQYYGSWTNHEISTSEWSFQSIEEAYNKYYQIEKTL